MSVQVPAGSIFPTPNLLKNTGSVDGVWISTQAPPGLPYDERLVQRQALASMLWNKQFYHYEIPLWLRGDPAGPEPPVKVNTAATADGLT